MLAVLKSVCFFSLCLILLKFHNFFLYLLFHRVSLRRANPHPSSWRCSHAMHSLTGQRHSVPAKQRLVQPCKTTSFVSSIWASSYLQKKTKTNTIIIQILEMETNSREIILMDFTFLQQINQQTDAITSRTTCDRHAFNLNCVFCHQFQGIFQTDHNIYTQWFHLNCFFYSSQFKQCGQTCYPWTEFQV